MTTGAGVLSLAAPNFLPPDQGGVVEPCWMRRVDREVRARECEALGTNIRTVRKSRVLLLRLRDVAAPQRTPSPPSPPNFFCTMS